MHLSKKGYYQFIINSSIGINAQIYKNYFYSMNPNINLLMRIFGDCTIGQIKFTIYLWPNKTYYLVVTTIVSNATYSYSVISTGPSFINFNQTSKYYVPSAVIISLYFSDISTLVQTEYVSTLTNNSHRCNRNHCKFFDFYCEIIEIHTTEAGYYVITTNSTTDMIGYVYNANSFTIFDLTIDVLKRVDYNCNYQFKMTLNRPMNTSFTFVLTTKEKLEQGAFTISIDGPSKVSMKRIGTKKNIIS